MKKFLMFLSLFVLFMGVSKLAFAETSNYEQAMTIVNDANTRIQAEVAKAQADADALLVQYPDTAGADYNQQLDLIINNVIDVTNQISRDAVAQAAQLGVELICEIDYYVFGNRTVGIDPLRVHDW